MLLDDPRAVVRVRDVRRDRVRTELGRRGLDLLGGAGRERESETLLSEHPSNRQADA